MSKLRFRGKALTIIQPWASAIAFGGKDIENRTWFSNFRGPLAIHAGGKFHQEVLTEKIRKNTLRGKRTKTIEEWIKLGQRKYGISEQDDFIPTSSIVAISMMTDCLEAFSSPWHESGCWGFKLEAIIPIVPVPMSGALSFWDCKFDYVPLQRT